MTDYLSKRTGFTGENMPLYVYVEYVHIDNDPEAVGCSKCSGP